MAFDYEDAGTFGSEREAKDWAQRNKVDLRDLHIRNVGGQRVEVGIRKSAYDQRARSDESPRKRPVPRCGVRRSALAHRHDAGDRLDCDPDARRCSHRHQRDIDRSISGGEFATFDPGIEKRSRSVRCLVPADEPDRVAGVPGDRR